MDYAKLALEEYNNEELSPHFGGKDGIPFWNVQSPQFIFTPSLFFPKVVGATKYRFTATDEDGKTYSFEADKPTAYLTPIWSDLPTGLITLKVEAIDHDGVLNSESGKPDYLSGSRQFFKADPFPGRENLPPKAYSYRECARKALSFVFNEPTVQGMLDEGKPPKDFPLVFFLSKMMGSIIGAMLDYAKLESKDADKAIAIARCAADYLIETSYGDDTALSGIPRTYMFDPSEGDEKEDVPRSRKNMVMMIYPAKVGSYYFQLAKETGDDKYIAAAMKIADFYKNTVLPNGSWPLLMSAATGEAQSHKSCVAFAISSFLRTVGKKTGDAIWYELDKNYVDYITKTCHTTYDWQAQFEDAPVSDNYSNLTHIDADDMVMYLANNYSDDPQKINEAEYLMRFIEDQFVVWGEFCPWVSCNTPERLSNIDEWHSPAGLEQYNWYVPIDGSTSKIARAMLTLYKVNKNPLLLEKACALADSITRIQNPETGMIPTHWLHKNCMNEFDNWFWFNCHIGVASSMFWIADFIGE